MLKIPTIQCNNFVLRQLNKKDVESIAKYANNKNIARNLTDRFTFPHAVRDSKSFITKNLSKKNTNNYVFGIEIDGEVVGIVSLGVRNGNPQYKGSFGYWLGEPFWGRGIMTEAVKQITKFGFKDLKLKRIEAQVYPHNTASASLLENNGFGKEGYLRKSEMHWGKLMDTILYAKIK